jgi:Fe-S cluster biogenesis protein NfuA
MASESTPRTVPQSDSLQALVESLSAYIEQYHGGAVRYLGVEGGVLKVKLEGACLGCPLSPNTLHGWVEGTVKQFFPEIERVEAVDEPSA